MVGCYLPASRAMRVEVPTAAPVSYDEHAMTRTVEIGWALAMDPRIAIGRTLPLLIRRPFLALAIQPRQVFPRRRFDPRRLRQPPEKLLVTLARIPPHNRAHRRVGLQRRRINRDPLAFQQASIGQHTQHPAEYFAMRVQIDQPPRARNRRVIGRVLVQRYAHETPQRQRVCQTPSNAALRSDALEIPDE